MQRYYNSEYSEDDTTGIQWLFDYTKIGQVLLQYPVIYCEETYFGFLRDKKVVAYEEGDTSFSERFWERTKNQVTYYYEYEEDCLKREDLRQSNKEETVVAEDVFAYQLLEDGTLVVMTLEGGEEEYNLYKIDKSGKKTEIARNVRGLFGKDTCYIKDSYELDRLK